MKKSELIDLIQKAKQIGIRLSEWNDAEKYFDKVTIEESGDFYVEFSQYRWGETDTDTVCLSFEDLSESIDSVVSKYKAIEKERLEQVKQKRELEEKKQAELKLIEKEKRDKAEYKRLKQKFNPDASN